MIKKGTNINSTDDSLYQVKLSLSNSNMDELDIDGLINDITILDNELFNDLNDDNNNNNNNQLNHIELNNNKDNKNNKVKKTKANNKVKDDKVKDDKVKDDNKYLTLCQKQLIYKGHPFYNECLSLATKSANIYNHILDLINEYYLLNKSMYPFNDIAFLLKTDTLFLELPTKVAKMTLRKVYKNFKSFFNANNDYKINPHKYKAKPNPPSKLKYDTFLVEYYIEAIYKTTFNEEQLIHPSKTNIKLTYDKELINLSNLRGVRIVPKKNYFKIEILYNQIIEPFNKDLKGNYCAIDYGVNNLCSLVFNNGDNPILINGRPVKSTNQYWNKNKADEQSKLKKVNDVYWSEYLSILTSKRNNKIEDYLHKTSNYIIETLKEKSINTLIVGYNKKWKECIDLGKVNNQKFVLIPYYKLNKMLEYKCLLNGIKLIFTEESYTSKCSFFDKEYPKYRDSYVGTRIKRGLFKMKNGKIINADVNAAYNIMLKAISLRTILKIVKEIEVLSVMPIKVTMKLN